MLDKRGQGLSLNVIIIAALALIVLVVLVVIFTGRIGVFERGVGEEGDAELVKMRIQYDDCRPTASGEANFKTEFGRAQSTDQKEAARVQFNGVIERCSSFEAKDSCESAGCRWKS